MAEEQKTVQKPKQKMRYSDEELSLIKNTFANADDLLNAIRKHFLQMPTDAFDQQYLQSISKNDKVLAVIRKAFLPTLDPKAPAHQLVDLWMTLELKEKTPEQAYPHMLARKTLIAYLEQQLILLEGKKTTSNMSLNSLVDISEKDPETAYADLVARNTAIGHTEMQISQFVMLAGAKEETVEQTKARLGKDSTK